MAVSREIVSMNKFLEMNGRAGASVSMEKISPEVATAMLERNTRNRPVNQNRVEAYAGDMKAGKWYLAPDAIAFAKDGSLLNGQHRLWAVIESGITEEFVVARGLDEETQGVMDLGQKRTNGQNYALVSGDAAGKKKMEVANFIHLLSTNDNTALTYSQSILGLEKYRSGIDWSFSLGTPMGVLRSAFVRGSLAFAWKTDPQRITEFAESLMTGADLREGDPALVLRNKLILNRATSGTLRRVMGVSVLRACVAHLNGEQIRSIFATEDAVAFFGKAWGLKLQGSAPSRGLEDPAKRLKRRAEDMKKKRAAKASRV